MHQVNSGVAEIDKVTQDNAAISKVVAWASEALLREAKGVLEQAPGAIELSAPA